MRFSKRTSWESNEDGWAAARAGAPADLVDLTASNPNTCGLRPDRDATLAPFGDARALLYTPDPLGMQGARAAVAGYYRDHGINVPLEHLCLTTSTSEAYSFLFRLLCDPGEEVLIARPSYPLFDLLAHVNDVELREYPLHYDPGALPSAGRGWSLDVQALQTALTPRTRAIVLVHPNNPTGNYTHTAEREALSRICAERGLALLVDEVFLDYPIGEGLPETGARTFLDPGSPCLCFVLSGVSKVCALPQMKLSWIAACGPGAAVREAMARLEIVADTFLSLSAPVQFALPQWMAARGPTQARIRERLVTNLASLDARLEGTTATRFGVEGGWTAVLRVPSTVDGEEFALAALRRGVAVQPGELYGFPAGRCVLSLLTPPEVWARGLERLPI